MAHRFLNCLCFFFFLNEHSNAHKKEKVHFILLIKKGKKTYWFLFPLSFPLCKNSPRSLSTQSLKVLLLFFFEPFQVAFFPHHSTKTTLVVPSNFYTVKSNAVFQSAGWLTSQQLCTQLILSFLRNAFGFQEFHSFSVPFASSSSFLQPLNSGEIHSHSLNFFSPLCTFSLYVIWSHCLQSLL